MRNKICQVRRCGCFAPGHHRAKGERARPDLGMFPSCILSCSDVGRHNRMPRALHALGDRRIKPWFAIVGRHEGDLSFQNVDC